MDSLNTIGWLALRLTVGFVYLYAMYMNTRDPAARQWLIEHTAYMFPSDVSRAMVRAAAMAGMCIMLLGGVSIILGLEGRVGAALLLLFTASGIYQHKRERDVASRLAQSLTPQVAEPGRTALSGLQWSAHSGHLSSGLKNFALCGVCAAIVAWGTGPLSISDHIGNILR